MTASQNPTLRPASIPRPSAPVVDFSQRIAKARASTPPPAPSTRPKQESTPPSSNGFSAAIHGAALADLIQLECMRGLTRSVSVRNEKKLAFLYFDQGQLVHAEYENLRGEEAALHILSWAEGAVEPADQFWIHPPTIETSWQGLLMMAAQRQDEAKRTDGEKEAPLSERTLRNSSQVNRPTPPPQIARSVRLDRDGSIIESQGELDDFPDAAAYAVRLAELIGEGLGLENFEAMECTSPGHTMLAYLDGDSIVALEGTPGPEIARHRTKAGL
jgi:Domain of unknown function (DUF4388)